MDDELIVMKAELQRKVVELENATSDISNLLANTNIATLFLDNDQHIRRFTPAATQFFSLLPTDAGRPLTDINSKLVYDQLHADCRVVLEKLIPVQKEVVATNGKWLNLISRGETMRIILHLWELWTCGCTTCPHIHLHTGSGSILSNVNQRIA